MWISQHVFPSYRIRYRCSIRMTFYIKATQTADNNKVSHKIHTIRVKFTDHGSYREGVPKIFLYFWIRNGTGN